MNGRLKMVNCKDAILWNFSLSMLFGKSPKITFLCGNCGKYNYGRISMKAIQNHKPYMICEHCGEVNNIQIKY